MPDGAKVHYVRTSPGTGFADAVFESTSTPGPFYQAQDEVHERQQHRVSLGKQTSRRSYPTALLSPGVAIHAPLNV
jgi:hypothetical protein